MFKLNMAALRKAANCEVLTPAKAANAAKAANLSREAGLAGLAGLQNVKTDSRLMANAANVANLANESGKSGAEISQQPPKLAGLAKLAISQQPERTLQADPAVNEPASQEPPELVTERQDPDRWSWPHSEAMTSGEIDAFAGRASQFYRRGMPSVNAEALAYKLVNRDRDGDDRRLCLECAHLTGQRGAWRCDQWKRAGMGAAGIPAGMVLLLQRCDGFRNASR